MLVISVTSLFEIPVFSSDDNEIYHDQRFVQCEIWWSLLASRFSPYLQPDECKRLISFFRISLFITYIVLVSSSLQCFVVMWTVHLSRKQH